MKRITINLILIVVLGVLLSSCANTHSAAVLKTNSHLLTSGNTEYFYDKTDTSLDVVFSIDNNGTIELLPSERRTISNASVEDINKFNSTYKEGDRTYKLKSCITLGDKQFSACSKNIKPDIFTRRKGKFGGAQVALSILLAPPSALIGIFDRDYVVNKYKNMNTEKVDDKEFMNQIGLIINNKMMEEYQKSKDDSAMLLAFMNRYGINNYITPLSIELAELYRKENTLEGFNKAYDITALYEDIENAYKVCKTEDEYVAFIEKYKNVSLAEDLTDKVRKTLLASFRGKNSFDGYMKAYSMFGEPADGKNAMKMSGTKEQKAELEYNACLRLKDKTRLFDVNVRADRPRVSQQTSWFSGATGGNLSINGYLDLKSSVSSPIKQLYGKYKVIVTATAEMPYALQKRSNWVGNADTSNKSKITKDIEILFWPSDYDPYDKTVHYDIGEMEVTYFHRGAMGGYTAAWPVGDAYVNVRIKDVECMR